MRRARRIPPGRALAVLLGPPLLAAACSPYALMTPARLREVATEELCVQRDQPIGGARIRRELWLRGADCEAIDAARAAGLPPFDFARGPLPPAPGAPPSPEPFAAPGSLPPPVPFARAAPEWLGGADPGAPPEGEAEPGAGGGARMGLPEGARPEAGTPVEPDDWPRAALAPPGAAAPAAPSPAGAAPGRASALAPLIAPGCAERVVEPGSPGRAGAVSFRNGCGVPIRVRFAARPGTALTEVTPLLRPGETSPPAPLAEGFAHPGYVVCSYERVPERALCR